MSLFSGSDPPEALGLPMYRNSKHGHVLLIGFKSETGLAVASLLISQGFVVTLASGVRQALDSLQDQRFSFILFDWFLKGANGPDLCKAIRGVNKKTQIFFNSQKAVGEGIQQAIEASVQAYRVRSVDTNPMLKILFLHLERHRVRKTVEG
jgi:DNA-binding response OmpR family regulator